jgi:hypothetical protein
MNYSIAIVTPLYKKTPSAAELASLEYSLGVLGGRKRFMVAPDGLDLSGYRDVLNECDIIRLDARHFESVTTYNRLMLSKGFYRLFAAFDYILLFQPDAIVFRDELDSWCTRGYDYIGAPWPGGMDIYPFSFRNHPLLGRYLHRFSKPVGIRKYMGNGGLSLRKVSSAMNILTRHWLAARKWHQNEDAFWALYSGNMPGEKEASMFSLEEQPSAYYRANGNRMPLGCHAWERYEPEFWRAQFKLEGLQLPQENKAERESG